MYYVYILQSGKDRRTYVGYAANLKQRLEEHNKGKVIATRYRKPFRIIYSENWPTKEQDKKRESYWKSGAGRRKMKSIIFKGSRPRGEARLLN